MQGTNHHDTQQVYPQVWDHYFLAQQHDPVVVTLYVVVGSMCCQVLGGVQQVRRLVQVGVLLVLVLLVVVQVGVQQVGVQQVGVQQGVALQGSLPDRGMLHVPHNP